MLAQCGDLHTSCLNVDTGKVCVIGYNGEFKKTAISGDRIEIPLDCRVIAIAAGMENTLLLDANGIIWNCSSPDSRSRYRQENFGIVSKLFAGKTLPLFTSVQSSSYFVVCIDADHYMWSVGHNMYGQLGDGTTTDRDELERINFSHKVDLVACGQNHTLCMDTRGTVYGFGCNDYGQIGISDFKRREKPTAIENAPADILMIACGSDHSILLNYEGKVFSFGSNYYGELGMDANKFSCNSVPSMVVCLPEIANISCGYQHTMCLDIEGSLWMFGRNEDGELGLGDFENRSSPVKNLFLNNVKLLSRGGNHTLVKDAGGSIWVFGNNSGKQLSPELDQKKCCTPHLLPESLSTLLKDVSSSAKSARK